MQIKGTLISLGIFIILITVITLFQDQLLDTKEEVQTISPALDSLAVLDSIPDTPVSQPEMLFGIPIDSFVIIKGKIKRNQSLSEILLPRNVTHEAIFKLANNSKSVFNVNKIKAGKPYTLFINERDSIPFVDKMVYEPSEKEFVVFHLNQEDSFKTEKILKPSEIVLKTLEGVIDESLSVTITDQGGSHELTNKIVDIFAWQLDFFRLQKGDHFKVIYEEEQIEGNPVAIHRIRTIYFNHFENDFYAFAYDQGEGLDYFDEDGNSLRKALLKYPLEFTRISSRYTLSRYHPVQKRWKSHKGTDLVAPRGTPIRSVGDGIVIEARYAKYNGNYVKIRHNSTYTTQYLHMSKIASGIKPGIKVKSGKVIGFVGSTGLATGPHLCYRFWKNGVQVDALTVDLPPSQPIFKEHLSPFEHTRDSLLQDLNMTITQDKLITSEGNNTVKLEVNNTGLD